MCDIVVFVLDFNNLSGINCIFMVVIKRESRRNDVT